MAERSEIVAALRAQIALNGHAVGAVVGSGMAAKFVAMAGIDFLVALSAGRFRIAGRGSYASYFCYANSNEMVMNYGRAEILPIIRDVPVLFGLFANDPTIERDSYLDAIHASGFSGVVNYPTVSLIDGQFREALEEDGNTYANEVEAIRTAHAKGMFTLGFVTNRDEAHQMLDAGADVICAHLGLTRGGYMGRRNGMSIVEAETVARDIFEVCEGHDVIRMVYSGPASTPEDMQFLYDNTPCEGYIGGSVFDRIPSEKAILDAAIAFRSGGDERKETRMRRLARRSLAPADYVDFTKQYVAENYSKKILLRDIARVLHVSYPYLSGLFHSIVGCTFSEYVLRYRMSVAKELLADGDSVARVAACVGYADPAQFSKTFKAFTGVSPSLYADDAGASRP